MSSDTWQEIWAVVSLLPWVGFVVGVVFFRVLALREGRRPIRDKDRPRVLD